MEFPKSFFEDEVRSGFYVSALMKRAWAAQIEVLADIDRVCRKHDIKYFAEWGTLLGVVRDKGFIPWDDDMDICMFRKDYEKFCEVALDELPEFYGLLNFEHSDDKDFVCKDYLTRVYTGNRIRIDRSYMEKFHGFPYVSGMDIFPLDYLPEDEAKAQLLYDRVTTVDTMAQAVDTLEESEREEALEGIEEVFDVKLDRSHFLSRQLYMLADKLCDMYTKEESQYIISTIAWTTKKHYRMPKECFEETVYMPFESFLIPVPAGYDALLRIKYGSYEVPRHAGGDHEYPFYRKQEVPFEEKNGPLFNRYHFEPEHLSRHHREEVTCLKDVTKTMLESFEKAHTQIIMAAETGNREIVVVLTEDCQDGAIALGTKIEEVKGEGLSVIECLEEYCEALYKIHEFALNQGKMDVEWIKDLLEKAFSAVKSGIQINILERKEIVFLPFRGELWDVFDGVYQEALQQPNTDVYVIPIPFYYKTIYGKTESEPHGLDGYPSSIPITDYKTFDFESHHPDVIFIQNPYDEYNFTTSVPEFFFSKNIKEYTDKLVYIPYFAIDEIDPGDLKALSTLDSFCLMPGVVHSDLVIVQSQQMRETYIDALIKFAGGKTKRVWRKKITSVDYENLNLFD